MYSILSTILLAGAALAAPATPAPRTETCVDKSQDVALWDVEKFDFHSSYIFTNPAHQNSWGYVNFTLSNPAVDYKPVCSGRSNQLQDFFYGTQVFDCEMPENAPDGAAATFTFSRPSGELRINQTWPCVDQGARFEAKGGVDLDLNCKDTTWENPDWELGQIYSSRTVTCNLVDAQAPIDEMSGVMRKH